MITGSRSRSHYIDHEIGIGRGRCWKYDIVADAGAFRHDEIRFRDVSRHCLVQRRIRAKLIGIAVQLLQLQEDL